jgi:hypothetical protein
MKVIVMRLNSKEFSDEDFDSMLENTSRYFIDVVDYINLDDLYEENMPLYRFINIIHNKVLEITKNYDILYIIDNQSLWRIISGICKFDEINEIESIDPIMVQLELLSGIINNFSGDVIIHKLKREPNGSVIHD